MGRRRHSIADWYRRRPLYAALVTLLACGAMGVAAVASLWASTPDVESLVTQNPRSTALMDQRVREAKKKGRRLNPRLTWRKLDEIPSRFQWAVLLSEDAAFFGHEGFDFDELQKAVKRNMEKGGYVRGASTLTQQLAKNLYLGTEKSLLRKAKEAVITAKLERALTKKRILTLYLNVVEWGDGVFGAESGARSRFSTSVSELSVAQSAIMAAMLPAPLKTNLDHPSKWLEGRSFHIVDLLYATKKITSYERDEAQDELRRIFSRRTAAAFEPPEAPPEEAEDEAEAL
ncbi:MAG: monofunctional biosynthetic peptidoglycan transglycosylase [Myxococcaceae bacterium]